METRTLLSTAHPPIAASLTGVVPPWQPEDIWSTELAFQNRTQRLPCYRVMDLEGIPIGKEPEVSPSCEGTQG